MPSETLRAGAATTRRRARATVKPVKPAKSTKPAKAVEQPTEPDRFSLDDSRLVRSRMVWRVFVFLSLVALGAGIIFAGNGHAVDAVLWIVIAVGWFGFAMGLWRKHTKLYE
jgi:hypothetical protein